MSRRTDDHFETWRSTARRSSRRSGIFDRSRDLASRQFFAWSEFSPVKVDAEIKVKSEAKLSAKLKLSAGELEGSTGTQSDFIIYQPVITAFNQGTARPAWEFRPAREIQMLYLTVRVPDDVERRGERTTGAE